MSNAIALGIAAFVATIGFMQWRTARSNFALNLFDRRYAVFNDVRRLVGEVIANGKLSDAALSADIIARGRFLFGDDLVEHLRVIDMLCGELSIGNVTAVERIRLRYDAALPVFARYMDMKDQVPRSFWQWSKWLGRRAAR